MSELCLYVCVFPSRSGISINMKNPDQDSKLFLFCISIGEFYITTYADICRAIYFYLALHEFVTTEYRQSVSGNRPDWDREYDEEVDGTKVETEKRIVGGTSRD